MPHEDLHKQSTPVLMIVSAPVVHWQYWSSRPQLVLPTAFLMQDCAHSGYASRLDWARAAPAKKAATVVKRAARIVASGLRIDLLREK